MDIATIIGIFSGIGLIVVAILQNSGLGTFIDVGSLMIVLGGTMAATLIAYPIKEFLMVMGLFVRVFSSKTKDPSKVVEQLVDLAKEAKKGGLLSLEKHVKTLDNQFLAKALQMTVDGSGTNEILNSMNKEMVFIKKKHKVGWEIFGTMGAYSPAFGMVGTLIGLVQMLADLSDPNSIGPKMAVALITTFYGTLFANLFFNPMSQKLQRRSAEETLHMNLLMEGVQAIREGENPLIMQERLMIYAADTKKSKKGDKGESKPKEKPAE